MDIDQIAGEGSRTANRRRTAGSVCPSSGFTEVTHFKPDTIWQKELEDSFPYVETEDQVQAITDIKGDMESPRPMDRLLCGDVGYGKTEVALAGCIQGGHGWQTGGDSGSDHRAGATAL